ncbi:MAG: tail fiber domain-containing protein, partial [Terriglobia bacterium]
EALLSLEPVTFRYKKALDPEAIPQFGLIAEQVARVDPDLVARDEEGKPYTVRYEAVNAMLLNEFLKEHRKVEALESTVAQLKSALQEQATQIQKVSERLASTPRAPRLVENR